MGILNWLANLFGSKPSESPEDVADRLERFGDRFRNAGDTEAEQAARAAADDARRAQNTTAALEIEQQFLRSQGLDPDGRFPKPVRGQDGEGRAYVRYGDRARAGGSQSWRYHNPGYVRCSDRATRYGAIGCDGEYAIFPDEQTGTRALVQTFQTDYPNHSIRDALRGQLPPGVDPSAIEMQLLQSGFDLNTTMGNLTEEQLDTAVEAFRDGAGWESGESLDRGSGSGMADFWSEPANGSDSNEPTPTDNS